MSRIAARFEKLRSEGRAGFIPFIMAGDPDLETSLALMQGLPAAGADIIELGVCFTDPMADGPAIQAAGLRALKADQTLTRTLDMVRRFRESDRETPVVLMGYYNPFFAYGVERFLADATEAGVDGLIIVDLPPEEDAEMCLPARAAGLDFIRLATPTTDAHRLPTVIKNVSGFVYYVSVAGVTGQKSGASADIDRAVKAIGDASGLPVAVGFGIKTPDQARNVAKTADAVVVGSALVDCLASQLTDGQLGDATTPGLAAKDGDPQIIVNAVLSMARDLAEAVRSAR